MELEIVAERSQNSAAQNWARGAAGWVWREQIVPACDAQTPIGLESIDFCLAEEAGRQTQEELGSGSAFAICRRHCSPCCSAHGSALVASSTAATTGTPGANLAGKIASTRQGEGQKLSKNVDEPKPCRCFGSGSIQFLCMFGTAFFWSQRLRRALLIHDRCASIADKLN